MNRSRPIHRQLIFTGFFALLLHFFFFLCIAPILKINVFTPPTEMVQISGEELSKIKKQILQSQKSALAPEEILNKTDEAPENARMIGPHNQKVEKEKFAGPQADAPQIGGGKKGGAKPVEKTKSAQTEKLSLSKLGFGKKIPPPTPSQQSEQTQGAPGPDSPTPGQFRPVGRDAKDLERGSQNLLNAVESKFYSFFSRMEGPIVRNWYFYLRKYEAQIRNEMNEKRIKPPAEIPVVVEFSIDRSGEFRSLNVISPSGIKTFDWACREAIAKLKNLPNPPPELFENGDTYVRQIQFTIVVDDGPGAFNRPNLNW